MNASFSAVIDDELESLALITYETPITGNDHCGML